MIWANAARYGDSSLSSLGDAVPVAVEQPLAGEVPAEGEVRVVVVVVEAEVPRLDRAAARDVDRRVRLLDRLRPAVDVAQLVVLAVEGERLVGRPRPHDQVVGLGVLVAGQRRDLAVAEVGVHRRADREAGDEPAAADAVEHGELLGDADRRVVEGDRVADHADRRAAGAAGQPGGDEVRAGHDAVAVLVVLVDADAVEAELVGVLELVHVLVVDGVGPRRVEQRAGDVDPDRAVRLPEVVGQVRPRHQVEPRELHGDLLAPSMPRPRRPRRARLDFPVRLLAAPMRVEGRPEVPDDHDRLRPPRLAGLWSSARRAAEALGAIHSDDPAATVAMATVAPVRRNLDNGVLGVIGRINARDPMGSWVARASPPLSIRAAQLQSAAACAV